PAGHTALDRQVNALWTLSACASRTKANRRRGPFIFLKSGAALAPGLRCASQWPTDGRQPPSVPGSPPAGCWPPEPLLQDEAACALVIANRIERNAGCSRASTAPPAVLVLATLVSTARRCGATNGRCLGSTTFDRAPPLSLSTCRRPELDPELHPIRWTG